MGGRGEPSFSNGTFASQSVLRPAGKSFAPGSYDSFLRQQTRHTDSIVICKSLWAIQLQQEQHCLLASIASLGEEPRADLRVLLGWAGRSLMLSCSPRILCGSRFSRLETEADDPTLINIPYNGWPNNASSSFSMILDGTRLLKRSF